MTSIGRRELDDEAATAALAAELAAIARPGDVLALDGTLGIGKSALARAFIRARCGRDEEVPSPTFTLVQLYDDPQGWVLYHFDLYRLIDPSEVFELDIDEAFSEGVSLIEWPERMGTNLPVNALVLHFDMGGKETARTIGFSGPRSWAARLREAQIV